MANNNNKKYVATQEKPATKCDSDFFNYIKLRARPSNTHHFPTSSTVSNPKIPKKETMVLQNKTITIKNSLNGSRKESKLETVSKQKEYRTMETEKAHKTKEFSMDKIVNEAFEFLKPSISSKHCQIKAHKKIKEEVLKTDTTKYILPAKCHVNPNFTFDYDNEKFVVKEISPATFEAGLWNYIRTPLNPGHRGRSQATHRSVVSQDLMNFQEYERPTYPLRLGINCDNFDTLTRVFHKIVPEAEQQNTYICSSCNTSSNGLPGNKCQMCQREFHWKCVAHTSYPNLSVSWFCSECITYHPESNPVNKPYLKLFNDTLHHNPN